jgi:hypothetical protein
VYPPGKPELLPPSGSPLEKPPGAAGGDGAVGGSADAHGSRASGCAGVAGGALDGCVQVLLGGSGDGGAGAS